MATLTAQIENAMVELLRVAIDYVPQSDIRGVVDTKTAINLGLSSVPAIYVEYAGEQPIMQSGESGSRLAMGGRHYRTDFNFDVYVIAASFSLDGAGRLDTDESPQAPGAYTMIDDVFQALAGSQLHVGGETSVFLSPRGVEPWGVQETYVVYKSGWHCPVTRLGAAVA